MYTMTDAAYGLLKRDITRILDGCKQCQSAPANGTQYRIDLKFDESTVCDRPQDYFHFQFGRFYICVIKNTISKAYSLQCYKWIPKDYECITDPSYADAKYGRFENINDALEAYYKTCKQCMDYCLNHPVEYMQLEIF